MDGHDAGFVVEAELSTLLAVLALGQRSQASSFLDERFSGEAVHICTTFR